jgi:phosphoribosylaminoimidazolecarboxamide formyltransferase/IMP cyclohydrolase
MVRAAAKNHQAVGVVTSPSRYPEVIAELQERGGELSHETRRRLAAEAFTMTAGYDAAISAWFMGGVTLPDEIIMDLQRERELPYGENPHQAAGYYVDTTQPRHLLTGVVQHGGKDLSYNNLADLAAAHAIANEFDEPACAIIKHQNPCGAAIGRDAAEAYERALAGDPVSAFGGVIAINRPITAELGARLAEQFLEVLIAPGYEEGALEALSVKANTRLLEDTEPAKRPPLRHFRPVPGGMLVQDPDDTDEPRAAMTVVTTTQPDAREWQDLLFAWRIVRHVSSNAIVIARDGATLGIGAGQMSRVDSVRIAVEKTPEDRRAGAVLASDAFFPFADGAELALQAGITGIIQPGGAKRDDEVTAAVDAAGCTMVHVGRRHFRH